MANGNNNNNNNDNDKTNLSIAGVFELFTYKRIKSVPVRVDDVAADRP